MDTSRTQPYFFAFDTKVKPGKMLAHYVVFGTYELDGSPESMNTNFRLLGSDVDKDSRQLRMIQAASSFKEKNPNLFP